MANKLYIWTGFCTDWSDGLAFAIAGSEEEAKEMVEKEYCCTPHKWGTLEVRGFSKCVRCVAGGG